MKLLMISSILPIPGVEKANDFVFQLLTSYRKFYKDDSIIIIKPVKYKLNPLRLLRKITTINSVSKKKSTEIEGFRVEIIHYFSTWRLRNLHALVTQSIYYLNKRKLGSLFKTFEFDIIHSQYIFSDGILAYLLSKQYKIPYFITTHNERFYFEHFISKKIALDILKNASIVLPINYSNSSFYKSIGLKNVELTPLGFSNKFVRNQKIGRNETTSILTVAELIKLKNIDKVILAIKKLIGKYKIKYTIVGKGPEKHYLQELVRSKNLSSDINFIEFIPHDQIADEMYKHDIFIMPSYFETFGRVYFEAMAMGIPIICARNSGIYGIFKNMEEGIAVDHTNIDEITNALEYLIANYEERIRIGGNGKKLVESYTWDKLAEELHDKLLKNANC